MLRFGRDVTGFNIIHFFSNSFDQILIGRFWGAGSLGFYRQAYQLMMLPMNKLQFPVGYVAEPSLSALQNEHDKYRQYYKKIISLLSFASMPLVMYLAIFSENFIVLLLGEKWIESASIFRILAIVAFIQPVASTCGFVMVTLGKTKQFFRWGVMNAICLITAFSIGIYWGPIGVAAAYAINTYVILVPSLWYGFRNTPVSIRLFFQSISLPVLSSSIMGLVLILLHQEITTLRNSVQIALSLLVASSTYCGLWLLFPGGKQKLIEYFSYPFVALKFSPSFAKTKI